MTEPATPTIAQRLRVRFLTSLILLTMIGCAGMHTGKDSLDQRDEFTRLMALGKREFTQDFEKQNFHAALAYFHEAESIYPDNQEVHYYLGYAYERVTRRDAKDIPNTSLYYNLQSSKHFKRVIEIHPEYQGELYISDPYTKLTSIWGAMALAYKVNGKPDSVYWAFSFGRQEGGFNPALVEYGRNLLRSCEQDALLFTNGDNDIFPLWYLQTVEGFRRDVLVINVSLLNCKWYVLHLRDNGLFSSNTLTLNLTDEENEQLEAILWKAQNVEIPVAVSSLNPAAQLAWRLEPTIEDYALRRQDLVLLQILKDNIGLNPIYYSTTVSQINLIGLNDYLHMEGLVYRLLTHQPAVWSFERAYENCLENYT